MVKGLPEFEYFTVFLKNGKFYSKIRISKVTEPNQQILRTHNQFGQEISHLKFRLSSPNFDLLYRKVNIMTKINVS